jgi:hypothetical protein
MKVKAVGYSDTEEEALIAIEGFPEITFAIKMIDINSKDDLIKEVKKRLKRHKDKKEHKIKFETLKIKELEGQEI